MMTLLPRFHFQFFLQPFHTTAATIPMLPRFYCYIKPWQLFFHSTQIHSIIKWCFRGPVLRHHDIDFTAAPGAAN